MAEFPAPEEGILLTHFIVSDDVERSRRFYTEVLGGETVREGEPSFVQLANTWIIINVGGGPTEDKPTVTLEAPPDPNRTSSFLNIRVADIQAVYAPWSRIPYAAARPRSRDPLLHPRPRRPPDRGRSDQPLVPRAASRPGNGRLTRAPSPMVSSPTCSGAPPR
jgi:catechol 2,3-dioxygenase-like lactoylglutathione lyase family enzyme